MKKVNEDLFNDNFIKRVMRGDVKNVKYNVRDVKQLRRGDVNFSFEMNGGREYVMNPDMNPYWAMKFIELFKRTAFKFIHKDQEKLNRLIERLNKDRTLKNQFKKAISYKYNVKTMVDAEDNIPFNRWNHYLDNEFKNVTDEDVTNNFRFTWYYAPDYFLDHGKEPDVDEIDELFEKNGGVRFDVTYDDYNLCGNMFLCNNSYYELNNLVEEQLERIRKIITETYFEEKEEEDFEEEDFEEEDSFLDHEEWDW